MHAGLAIVIGIIFASGVFLMLRRNIVKFVFGLALVGQAVNLAIFVSSGLTRYHVPLIAPDQLYLSFESADPLPQAMILTAIVIGFGLLAFTIIILLRTFQLFDQVDSDQLTSVDKP